MNPCFPWPDVGVAQPEQYWIKVEVSSQCLALMDQEYALHRVPVSTSKFGLGCEDGSYRTPTGWHRIAEVIGRHQSVGTQFSSRQPNGTIWNPDSPLNSDDMILSRIYWLDGTEQHNLNSKQRYIYIHGTNQENLIGSPASHGCIRMLNMDICYLGHYVMEGTRVLIQG